MSPAQRSLIWLSVDVKTNPDVYHTNNPKTYDHCIDDQYRRRQGPGHASKQTFSEYQVGLKFRDIDERVWNYNHRGM
jgi:hypothetical protein